MENIIIRKITEHEIESAMNLALNDKDEYL